MTAQQGTTYPLEAEWTRVCAAADAKAHIRPRQQRRTRIRRMVSRPNRRRLLLSLWLIWLLRQRTCGSIAVPLPACPLSLRLRGIRAVEPSPAAGPAGRRRANINKAPRARGGGARRPLGRRWRAADGGGGGGSRSSDGGRRSGG
jgi:hypothetical protein